MFVTLTPNPSLDRTVEISALVRGEVLRATSNRVDPGGKGVNVSRVLAANGHPTVAVLPSGGLDGARLADLLAPQGVVAVSVPVEQPTRSNITLVEPDGTTTKLNEAGPELSPVELAALEEKLLAQAGRATWVVLCGSLPRGVDAAFYARLTKRLHDIGVKVALDTSGDPFAATLSAEPDVIKPNDVELAELVGRPLPTLGDVAAAAAEQRARGVPSVLVSLGAAGALLVDGTGTHHAQGPRVEVRSTVGAGDCTLAGFLAGGAEGPDALRLAVAYGTAAVTLPGSAVPGPPDLHPELVDVVTDPDPGRAHSPRGA